ncbi:DUF262 domain-containing protein [Streptomyces sp. NPDC005426]|uniref:DUF262 domain-containing protein n=1 Tax=Streptomyces sp. NPDC005426 TaxID=3155344 RepID=UPI0033BBE292
MRIMAQLEAREVPLHKVFCSDYDFRIPDYQRPYAWQPEQAQQLLADLEEAPPAGRRRALLPRTPPV